MQARLTLRNYRCFRAEQPAVIEFGPGFSSFIGPNNAGKSTILKFFYELRNVISYLQTLRSGGWPQGMFDAGIMSFGQFPPPITDSSEIVHEAAHSPLQFELEVQSDDSLYVKKAVWTYLSQQNAWTIALTASDGALLSRVGPKPTAREMNSVHVVTSSGATASFDALVDAALSIAGIQYIGPFRNAVNEGAGSYYDLQLGTGFVAQWHHWKTGGDKKMNRAVGRVTEDVRRLMGVRSLEINASNELKTLQISVDGRPHKLSELGSGISQLIVVLGNALIKEPSFIAIDEPETHLHPGLQLDFLTTLASYSRNGVIFATHSIGLARAISDRMYSVQSGEQGSVVRSYEKTPNYAEFLGSLGLAGLQDIGWNKILLVEGTSDVRTFQQLLRKYSKDREIVVLPLGGSSMINGKTAPHLEEIVRLTGSADSVFSVIDSERTSVDSAIPKERGEFAKNCQKLGVRCLITERRATENYLTERAIKATGLGERYSALGPYAAPGAGSDFWGKSENWRVAREMTLDELNVTDIGRFLLAL